MMVNIKPKTILLIVSVTGMTLSAYLAAKKTPEAQKRKEEALAKKREATGDPNAQLTFFETIQAQIGSYAPAIVSGAIAVGTVLGSDIVNKENLKKAEKSFNDFKDMTAKFEGKGAVKTIEKAVEEKNNCEQDRKKLKPWEQKEHFRIVFQGHSILFESTRADVMEAFYEVNRYFNGRGRITFNEFLEYLGQESVPEGDDRGWEEYVGEVVYGYKWIDFGLKECEDEPWVTEIYMPVYPHFFEEEDCDAEIEEGVVKWNKEERQMLTGH